MFIPLMGFQTNLAALLLNSSTQMALPPGPTSYLGAQITPGNFGILAISDGVNFEIVDVTGISGGLVTIARAQEGTTASTFGTGATVRFVWTVVGIDAVSGGAGGITVAGSGLVSVSAGPAYLVNVTPPNFISGTGISVSGSWPNITVTNTAPGTPGPSTIVTGSGIAVVSPIVGGYNVDVPSLLITAGVGIEITGGYPHYIVTNTQIPGGTGTVVNVQAGVGIGISGVPTSTPIVNINPTGIVPGVYGALTVSSTGQIQAIAGDLITSIVSTTTALVVSIPIVGEASLSISNATTVQAGIVQLAAPTSAASNNAGDSTSAVTPAGINAVFGTIAKTQFNVVGQQIALPSASYAQALVTALPLSLIAGQKALITAFMEVYDTVTLTNIPQYAMALFSVAGAALLTGNSVVSDTTRQLSYIVTGPFSDSVQIKYTTLGVNQVVGSYSIAVSYA